MTAVIAHRGASAEAPENSMPAFELGMDLGADAIELDVRRSADGELLVIHDPTLDRTSDRTGRVDALPARVAAAANLGAASDPAVPRWPRPTGVPRLADVFRRFPDTEITVDVKDPDAAADVVTLVTELGRVDRTILYVEDGTESEPFLAYPGRRATSTRQALRLALDHGWLDRAPDRVVPEVLHAPVRRWGLPIVTHELVRRVQDSGRTVQVWTVNDRPIATRLAGWGVDGLITDEVRQMRRWIDDRPGAGPEGGGA